MAAPTMPDKRQYVKQSYNNQTWHDKVDKMSDAQVAAMYNRLLAKEHRVMSRR